MKTSMTQEPRMNLLEQRLFGFHPEQMSLFSASRTKVDQNLKTHCSFDAEPSENVNEDISLASKATWMPFTDVSMSRTKKNEPKIIHLFGTRITVPPQESSSLSRKAASMPFTEVTIFPTKKRSRASMIKEMSHCLFNAKSSENAKEELKEDARMIKKVRRISNKERKGEKLTGVSTELDLNIPPCTVRKTLTASDIGNLSRLMLATSQAESHILSHLSVDEQRTIQEGNGVNFKLYDHDTNTEHGLVLKRMVKTTRSYVFQGRWVKEFVDRRHLKQGHKIGLFWNYVYSRLHFCVLSPAPADHKNPN